LKTLIALMLLSFPAFGQAPVQPQSIGGLAEFVEFDIRFKGVATATNPAPTVKLASAVKFPTLEGQYFRHTEPCWNKTSACPVVVSATVQIFVRLPWIGTRTNVTRYLLCAGTECAMPSFQPMTAKPGEGFQFEYDRVKAVWNGVPSVVSMSALPPPPPETWLKCAVEHELNDYCYFSGRREVRYGTTLATAPTKVAENVFVCSNAGWGSDPAPGSTKTCWFSGVTTTAPVTLQ
jgi:hypothetical protein